MKPRKSLGNVVGISLGGIGIAVCVAAMIILWTVAVRFGRVTESLFNRMDRSLVAVRQRVVQTQDRVAAAKISTEDIEESLRDWTRRETGERLAVRLNAEERTEKMASTLQQADVWLEAAESSVGLVREVLSIATSTSAVMDTSSVDKLIDEIASLRGQLGEATKFVAGIHERVAGTGDGKSLDERIQQVVQLALRVVATLSSMDSRLGEFADRLSDAQSHIRELLARTQRRIVWAASGVTLLIIWMAAGQVALCFLGWRGMRRGALR